MFLIRLSICVDFIIAPSHQDSGTQIYTKKIIITGKLSGQYYFGQKGQSYCSQRGQSCLAKRGKVAWLFQTPQEVVENVHKAAELLKTQGKEGLEILRDPQYELNTGDAYIFIIDVEESLVVSNPRFPERNGGNIREHLDWAGKHYGIELCDVAMQGGGWIEFVWPKPGTTEGVRKISYIYPVPGLRYTVCAGIYDDTMSLDELNRMSGVSPKSPKVAVLFEVKPKTEGKEEYLKLAAALKAELAKMPGFIRVERFASLNEEGKLLSLSVWENEDAAAAWRNQLNHRGSQKKGHDALFERYHISVASIIREYTQDDRKEAPADSNQFLGIK